MICVNGRCIGLLLIICFMLSILFFCISCQSSSKYLAGVGTLPDESLLQRRLKEYHDALGNNDIAAWYAMTSPTITEKLTFEEFKKNFRWDENASNRTKMNMQAELGKTCGCMQQKYLRCVLVINIDLNESGRNPRTEKLLETWEYARGEWFWVYMGPDTRGKCPGQ